MLWRELWGDFLWSLTHPFLSIAIYNHGSISKGVEFPFDCAKHHLLGQIAETMNMFNSHSPATGLRMLIFVEFNNLCEAFSKYNLLE